VNREIPAVDLRKQYLSIREEIDTGIARVLDAGQFILGAEVKAFEHEFAEYCGVKHAIGVDSGTSAIQLCLSACSIGAGDEVITVSHTAVATVAAIERTGAKPILVDIDPASFTLDPSSLSAALTEKTRAIVPVHLYGCPADMQPIVAFAHEHSLLVIEDCAQAHGARYKGRLAGSWGNLSTFSFYPTKNLGAFGDAGAVLTNSAVLAKKIKQLRQYGWNEDRISDNKGANARLDEIQAAVLRVKLRHLPGWNERRRSLAELYRSLLAETDLILPIEPPDIHHVYHQFVIRHPQRDALKAFLETRGIQSQIHYPSPVHLQPAYRNLGYLPGSLPVTESITKQILSLPIYPELEDEQVREICRAIQTFLDQG